MLPVAQSFCDKLTSCEYRFTHNEAEGERKEHMRVSFNGKHGNSFTFLFVFDEDGTTVSIKEFSGCKTPSEKLMDMYVLVNELNAEYRWAKFYLDSDNDVILECDAVVEPVTAGEELFELMSRFCVITDTVYPRMMKILWS